MNEKEPKKNFFLSEEEEMKEIEEINNSLKEYEEMIKYNNIMDIPKGIIILAYKISIRMAKLPYEKDNIKGDERFSLKLRYERNLPFPGRGHLAKIRNSADRTLHRRFFYDNKVKKSLNVFKDYIIWFNEFYSQNYYIQNPFKIDSLRNTINSILLDPSLTDFKQTSKKSKNFLEEDETFSKEYEKSVIKEINDLINTLESKVKFINNKAYYYDIILYGQRISESMIRLYLQKEGDNGYYKNFKVLGKYCSVKKIFPQKYIDFLTLLIEYRNESISGADPTYDAMKSYLETLSYFLIWFNEFYSEKYSIENQFKIEKLNRLIQSSIIKMDGKNHPMSEYTLGIEKDPISEIDYVKKLKVESQELQKRMEKLNQEDEKLQLKKEELEKISNEIKVKIKDLQEINKNMPLIKEPQERHDLIEEIEAKEKIRKELMNRTKEIEDEINEIYHSVRYKKGVRGIVNEDKIEELYKESNEIKNQKSQLEEDIFELNEKIRTLDNIISTYDTPEIERINLENRKLIMEREKLNDENKKLNERRKDIEAENKKLQKKVDSLKRKERKKNISTKDIDSRPNSELSYRKDNFIKSKSTDFNYNNLLSIKPQKNSSNIKSKQKEPSSKDLKDKQKEDLETMSKTIEINQEYLIEVITKLINENFEKGFEGLVEEIIKNRSILQRVEEKIDTLIKNIDGVLDALQSFCSRQIENATNSAEVERIIANFTEEYIQTISDYSDKIYKKEEYEKEKIKLQISLGESAWDKLSDKSKTFLVTSKVMYNDLLMVQEISDYSGVCILVTKALEEEMFKRFFTNFIAYCKERFSGDYSKYHTALVFRGYDVLREENFSMGSIAFLLCYDENRHDTAIQKRNNEKVLLNYCKNHIFSNKTENEIKRLLHDYAENIEKIRKDYRNPSAHRNEIKRINAEECFNLVLDVEKLLKKMLDSFDK